MSAASPRHVIRLARCHACGAVGKFRCVSSRITRNGRVSYVKCRVCGASATFVYETEGRENGK